MRAMKEVRSGKGRAFAPQAKPRGIGQIVHVGRTRGRGIDHAGARQAVLQFDTDDALLRALGGAEPTFTAGDTAHRVRFVEQDHAVEIRRQPFQQLLEAGLLAGAAAQRGIGGKQDAIGLPDLRFRLDLGERLNVERDAAKRLPVAAGVLDQALLSLIQRWRRCRAAIDPSGSRQAGGLCQRQCHRPGRSRAGKCAFSIGHQFETAFRHAIAAGKIG
jgi:hypothetical protein